MTSAAAVAPGGVGRSGIGFSLDALLRRRRKLMRAIAGKVTRLATRASRRRFFRPRGAPRRAFHSPRQPQPRQPLRRHERALPLRLLLVLLVQGVDADD